MLGDPRIGGFDVRTMINASAAEVNEAVEDFFADREPDDLLVLHFSGHGVKDEAGELHFATTGTKLSRLAGTAVSADFVARRMNRSRSRRIVLLLDCCYSGAFGRGMVARAGGPVGLEEQFGGSGRAVITASSAVEYAFEGAAVTDTSAGEPSVFTAALVEGLETGDADRDLDGHVGLDELYEYVYDRVRRVTPHQTPGKWMLDVRGDLHIARRARPVSVPVPLPPELQEALDHSLPGVRAGAVPELRRLLSVSHEGRALAARLALRRLADDDSRMVAAAAREALGEHLPEPRPAAESRAVESRASGSWAAGARWTSPVAGTGGVEPSAVALPEVPAAESGAIGAGAARAWESGTESRTARPPAEPRKLSVPPETMGVGTSASPEGGQAGSIQNAAGGGGGPGSVASGSAAQGAAGLGAAGLEAAGPGVAGLDDADSRSAAQGAVVQGLVGQGSGGQGSAEQRLTGYGSATHSSATHGSAERGTAEQGAAGRNAAGQARTEGSAGSRPPGHGTTPFPDRATLTAPLTARLIGTLPRLAAGLALVLLVTGYMTHPAETLYPLSLSTPNGLVFTAVVPWALVAALFVLTGRDHPWLPGAALGLLAGTTSLIGESLTWLPYGLAAVALAIGCAAEPRWLGLAGGGLGAVGVYVVAAYAYGMTPLGDDGEDITLILVAAALTCLAAYRLWLDKAWVSGIAPALLLLDAVVMVSGHGSPPVLHAALAGLVVVPLLTAVTTGTARFAGLVVIAGTILFRANEFVTVSEPDFATVAHVALPVAAAFAAYFSRSR